MSSEVTNAPPVARFAPLRGEEIGINVTPHSSTRQISAIIEAGPRTRKHETALHQCTRLTWEHGMGEDRVYTVLFLSQRGAARSVMAAALLNELGRGKFRAFNAGVRPAAAFDPLALELLEHAKIPTPEGTPQHYRDFAGGVRMPSASALTQPLSGARSSIHAHSSSGVCECS